MSAGQDPDRAVVAALLRGDEDAFSTLVERLHPRIVRLCRRFVTTDAAAEDVAQDTWQAVLQGLESFEGRCALDTWVIQIAINRAKTRGARDEKTRPFADEDAIGADRFGRWGQWREPPRTWPAEASPESAVSNRELVNLLIQALEALPPQQRMVVTLRDVEAMTAAEVCEALALSEENQRVLLHRARLRLRSALEDALAEQGPAMVPA